MSLSKEDQKSFNDKSDQLLIMLSDTYNQKQSSLSLFTASDYYNQAI